MHAVESLGSATVLCSDKTGTITQNKMQVQQLWADGERFIQDPQKKKTVPESLHPLIEYGILASRKDPFDPMEKAFLEVADQKLIDVLHVHPSWDIVREYPLSQGFFSVTNVWKNETAKTYEVAAKGAVETIMDICHLDEEARSAIFEEVSDMAGKGLRILAVAKGTYAKGEALPESQHDFDFDFLGLVALADPIRPTASEAIGLCHQAGIRVVMITGDYPQTASNIAGQIGLDNPSMVMTGMELETLEDSVLQEKLKHCNVFARVIPEQKLQLIKALKANGERVAMTGDGVNDAPALKASDIGIAMGQRGTDVAREASSLVLLDDDFSSIVWAVRIGRRIFDNLRKAMAYIVSVHIPIAGMSIIPVLFQWKELALLPVHIVFLELLIDPACSIVFECEEEEAGVMQRTPASYASSLFSRSMLFISSLQGLVSLLFVLCTWFGFKYTGFSLEAQRTGSFITLIISNLALILTNRSWTERISKSFRHANAALGWVMSAALIFLALVISIRPLQQVFHFASIPLWAIGAATLSGMLSIVWFELYKNLKGRSRN
jgi:Ca2+-transporting ATPase